MNFSRKISQILLLASLPAIMWLYYNQAANWHYHVLSNGMIVEHAHPFANKPKPGTPFQQHQHSDLEYSILAELSNALVLVVALMAIAALNMRPKPRHATLPAPVFVASPRLLNRPLRAPPLIA